MVVYMFCTVTESCWEKIFSLKSGYCSKILSEVCYITVLVYGLRKKKSPEIPAALITTTHKTSYHINALSGLIWDFMQITVTVSVHMYTMMNAGFITEQ